MIETDFTPKGVCARNIHVVLSDDGKTIESVEFTNGCNGNLKAIAKPREGRARRRDRWQDCRQYLRQPPHLLR